MKILFDLSAACEGFSGIGQDSRQIFWMLKNSERLSVSGLVYSLGRPAIPRLRPGADDEVARIAGTLKAASLGQYRRPSRHPLSRLYTLCKEVSEAYRSTHPVDKLPDWLKTDSLWRLLFENTLPASERQRMLTADFFVSDVGVGQMCDRAAYLPHFGPKRIAVHDQDAIVFPLPRPLEVPPSVRKVVRYHDAIPLTHPDAVGHWLDIVWHYKFTNICAENSVFVCNSPASIDDLDNVAPGAGDHAAMIPCAVQPLVTSKPKPALAGVLRRRLCLRAANVDSASSAATAVWTSIEKALRARAGFRYVISVSRLEPRKNFNTAIAAWEQLRALTGDDIKFILVANEGSGMEPVLDAMRPHVLAGNLIHLTGLTRPELQVLYQEAEMCVFVSLAEGFGYAPLEALQAGVPVVASDLPVFRWTLEDAALFADPYDIGEIAESMGRLTREEENAELRARLLQRAGQVVERFSVDAISRRWLEFFDEELPRLDARRKAARRKKIVQH